MPTAADSFVDDDENFENQNIQNSTEINNNNNKPNYFHQEPIESHSFQTSNPVSSINKFVHFHFYNKIITKDRVIRISFQANRKMTYI